mgnify:CR=1 FL=1
MSRVTSKFQITLPRKVARAHRIEPGSEISFVSSGESLRLLIDGPRKDRKEERQGIALASFDAATDRQSKRNRRFEERFGGCRAQSSRGWVRDDLYADRLGK